MEVFALPLIHICSGIILTFFANKKGSDKISLIHFREKLELGYQLQCFGRVQCFEIYSWLGTKRNDSTNMAPGTYACFIILWMYPNHTHKLFH